MEWFLFVSELSRAGNYFPKFIQHKSTFKICLEQESTFLDIFSRHLLCSDVLSRNLLPKDGLIKYVRSKLSLAEIYYPVCIEQESTFLVLLKKRLFKMPGVGIYFPKHKNADRI